MNVQSVADLFDGGDRGAVVAPANDIIQGRLRDARKRCHTVDGNIVLGAQFEYALARCFSDIQDNTPSCLLDTIIVTFFYQKT